MFCFNPCILQVRVLKPGRSLGSLLRVKGYEGKEYRTEPRSLYCQSRLFSTHCLNLHHFFLDPCNAPHTYLKKPYPQRHLGAEKLRDCSLSAFPIFLSFARLRIGLWCVCVCVCVCMHVRTCECACAHVLSRVWSFATTWTVTLQAPLSMGFPRQGYWSGLPFPSPEDLPDPKIEPTSLASPALAGRFFTICATFDRKSKWIVRNWKGFWSLGGNFLGF